jgi:hypothetical protein
MSRFAVVYEDPDYDDDLTWDEDEADWEDSTIYVEEGVVKPFDQWKPESQLRLMADVVGKPQREEYSPYETMNS